MSDATPGQENAAAQSAGKTPAEIELEDSLRSIREVGENESGESAQSTKTSESGETVESD